MSRKGQVTVFIIIGLLLLIAVGVYLFFYTDIFQFEGADVERIVKIPIEPNSIKDYVRSCIDQISRPLLFEISEKGGTFQPKEYGLETYNAVESVKDNTNAYISDTSSNYTHTCNYEEGHGCVSNLITRQEIQKELNQKIREKLPECLDLAVFEGQGYEYKAGDIKVSTLIGIDDVNVILEYPLVFTQGEIKLEFIEFSTSLDVPLGRLFDLGVQVANEEAENYYFEAYKWMAEHDVNIKIYKHKPYPNILYTLAKKIERTGEILRYNFALPGHDTSGDINQKRVVPTLTGWCYIPQDKNCYANAIRDDCNAKEGTFSDSKPAECKGATTFVAEVPAGKIYKDCGDHKHGESWCEYDSLVSPGFDFVGSRHFLRSCIDGEIFYEECRDYREEICVTWAGKDYKGQDIRQSTCKPNNWQKCVKQADSLSCSMAGDCYWSEWLDKPDSEGYFIKVSGGKTDTGPLNMDDILRSYSVRKCIPKTPPGFKHWKGEGADVCAMANQLHDDDYDSGPLSLSDSSNAYCYFMGDCGNYFNFADQYTAESYFNTDLLKQEDSLNTPFELFPGFPAMADQGLFVISADPSKIDKTPMPLEGNEFVTARTSYSNALQQESSFWSYAASKYTYSSFESHVMKHIASLDFPITIHYGIRHVALCSIWGAPENPLDSLFGGGYTDIFSMQGGLLFSEKQPTWTGVQMCEVCNSNAQEKHKPCSEYRCKSLGKGCVFSYEEGIGVCREADSKDSEPPEIDVKVVSPDLSVEDDTIVAVSPSKIYEGKRLCHGACSDDDSIIDGLEPYSSVELEIEFSELTQCRLSYFPQFDYKGIPIMFVAMFLGPVPMLDGMDVSPISGSEFKTSANLTLPIYPESEITKELRKGMASHTLLEFTMFPEEIGLMMTSMAISITTTMSEAGDIQDAQAIDRWVMDYYLVRPLLTDTFSSAQSALNVVISEAEQGNTLLFFDCNDMNGNSNQPFYIKYATVPDRTPAKLLYAEPANDTELPEKTTEILLHLNEPADCSFSLGEDMEYDAMPYSFECQTTSIQSLDGTFHCRGIVQFENAENLLFVRCKDQPLPVKDYTITLHKSNSSGVNDPEMSGANIEVDNTSIFVNDESALLYNPSVNVTGNAELSIMLGTSSVCKMAIDKDQEFNAIPDENMLQCSQMLNKTYCKTTLELDADVKGFVIKCVDTEAYSLARNVNPKGIMLRYTRPEE